MSNLTASTVLVEREEDIATFGNSEAADAVIGGRRTRGRIQWSSTIAISLFHLGALLAFLPMFFTWKAFFTLLVLQLISGLGVTVGFHRLLTHRSFKTFKPVEYLLSILGSLSLQGGPIKWVATHRLHHQHSDKHEDPHSPLHGFFWAHTRWCCTYDPQFDDYDKYSRYALDLARDPVHVFIEKTPLLWTFLLGAALYWFGGWPCIVWGMFVRLVYVYHITWFINSASHTWGYKTFPTRDESRNLWWLALISFGEGWHNNHHAYPRSARHGLKFWEFDISWIVIRTMSLLGLARSVSVPNLRTEQPTG